MKVSVCLITYNHAPFIRQAIDSVLMQQTDFDFELLIGEDDSQDGTRDIVRDYTARHPDKIRLFLHDRKNVLYINGQPTSKRNFVHNLKEARGNYVALLDGDDYWISPHKLQKQVDFLDRHPECSACFNPARILFENGDASELTARKVAKDFYRIEDILRAGFFIPTCSYFFRNRLFPDFPGWFFTLPMSDLPLHILVAQHGLLGCLEDVMSIYRVHAGGFASGGARDSDLSSAQRRKQITLLVGFYKTMGEVLDKKYLAIIRDKLSMLNYDAAWSYQQDGSLPRMRHHLREAARAALLNSKTPVSFVLKAYLVAYGLYFDPFYRGCRRVLSRK